MLHSDEKQQKIKDWYLLHDVLHGEFNMPRATSSVFGIFVSVKVDYIIAGQGLAGTCLTWQLHSRGKSVFVADDAEHLATSLVAPGMFNPVVFKRLTKSWKADDVIPYLHRFYREIENHLDEQIISGREIFKVYSTVEERNNWLVKSENPSMSNYLSSAVEEAYMPDHIAAPLGGGIVKQAGSVDINRFLPSFREWLQANNSFIQSRLNSNDLVIHNNKIVWKSPQGKITASCIVFCEGARVTTNPLFNWLPFIPTKGEVLLIHVGGLNMERVVKKGISIIPSGTNTYVVGSTYTWDDLTDVPTDRGREELCEKLEKVLKSPYEVLFQRAGIRPAVKDRRPILGLHPKHSNVAIFNGVGTKGVMLAPFFSNHLANHLEGGASLDAEVKIERFANEYQQSLASE